MASHRIDFGSRRVRDALRKCGYVIPRGARLRADEFSRVVIEVPVTGGGYSQSVPTGDALSRWRRIERRYEQE